MTPPGRPGVVLLGDGLAGFAWVAVAVILIDRHNCHLFQSLLYQVATVALAPNAIAARIRTILRAQQNVPMFSPASMRRTGQCQLARATYSMTSRYSPWEPVTPISATMRG
jgi:hypothetical protein